MEHFPKQPSVRRAEKYESPIGNFDIKIQDKLETKDIELGDRVIIYTQSGNRYLLRHSASRNEKVLIYSERDGNFKEGSGHTFSTKTSQIAEVGSPLQYFAIVDETASTGTMMNSTKVTKIEILKGAEAAIRDANSQGKSASFGGIASALIDRANGR